MDSSSAFTTNNLSSLSSPLADLKDKAVTAADSLDKANAATENFAKVLAEIADKFKKAIEDTSNALTRLTNKIDKAFAKFESFVGGQAGKALHTQLGKHVSGAASGLIQGFSKAVGGLTMAIGETTKGLDSFVNALSPGTMVLFNQAMENLNATIGTAFIGVFQVFIGVLEQIGGELLPVMQQLEPVIRQLAQIIGTVLISQTKIFAASLSALMPFFQAIANVLSRIIDAMQPIYAMLEGWEALGSVVADMFVALTPYIMKCVDAFKVANEQILLFAVSVAKALGYTKFVEGVKGALTHDRKIGAHAAGQTSLKGLESLNKDIQKLAFGASGKLGEAAPQSDNEKLLAKIDAINPNETVKEIMTVLKEIQKTIGDFASRFSLPSFGNVTGGGSTFSKAANVATGGLFGIIKGAI